jgi:hypothetical protein
VPTANSTTNLLILKIYRLISYEYKLYLPAIQIVSIAFLKHILASKKISIHLDKVRPINVPFYSGLSIEKIPDFGGKYVDVQNAFPDKNEKLKFECTFICNVINSLVGKDFQQWLDDKVNEWNKKVAVEGDKIIELTPIIAAVFQNSTAISTTNGRSFSML